MLDFTSALYLGMQHSSESLRPWAQLTTGRPAVFGVPANQQRVADKLAKLIGCQSATLGTSTLHLFWDFCGFLAKDKVAIYMDSDAYPIARWGAERATDRGTPMRLFKHHDPDDLERLLSQQRSRNRRPIVMIDGYCPACGNAAPLAEYLERVRAYKGYLILDDTQALGILGRSCRHDETPYGKGGGGSLRWQNIQSPDILVISSLAKGFGVPLAILAGSREIVKRFEINSETRIHSSPPSVAVVHAVEHAQAINKIHGETLRSRLAQRVLHFRQHLAEVGLETMSEFFPVQTLKPMPERYARLIHQRLLNSGIRAVLQRSKYQGKAVISFLITVRHRFADIERAVRSLGKVLQNTRFNTRRSMEKDYEFFKYEFGII